MSRKAYLATLGGIYLAWWVLMAIQPKHFDDWLLENVLVVVAAGLLVFTYKSFPLSRVSYTCIFVFMMLHALGAHYTYAEVPYQQWFPFLQGERNHFDRLVHFLYGLLLAYPIREVFLRIANVRGFWGYFLPLDLTMSTSMLFELIEWGAVLVVGGDLGQAYLGTQGDEWDAHKDMALASLGALISMCVTAGINIYLQRDFAHEWAESLRIHGRAPLGEVAIRQMLQQKGSA
jgi:putative membrane protein